MTNDEQRAYEAYRRRSRRRRKHRGFYNFTKILAVIYVIALVVFSSVLFKVDILPGRLLIAVIVILVLLSTVLFIQLFFRNIKMWAKVSATIMSILLLVVYSMGSAYAMGAMSFLDRVTNDNNPKAVQVTEEPFNVLITGIDTRGKVDTEGRSDVNMIATVNPKTGKVLLTSVPRDYQIRLVDHDYTMDKLTHTGFYGTDCTIGALEDLFGITINYYVKVNFSTVEQFIDAIGGVNVYSEYEFNPVKMKSWTVQKGWNKMNGEQALAFARERKAFLTGDNQRIKNQQAVMEALLKKATSGTTMVLRFGRILDSLADYFEMNMSSSEIRGLIKMQLMSGTDWDIEKNTVTGFDGSEQTYSTGDSYAYVMTQDQNSISNAKEKMDEVMEMPQE